MEEKRSNLADILKAIGIISVVLGHCCVTISPLNIQAKNFVYSYHLLIFFLVTGFCYNAKKYIPNPGKFVWKRFLSIYVMDVVYTVIFILLHNTFVSLKMVTFGGSYNGARLWAAIKDALILNSTSEAFLSPLWFLPVFLVAVLSFGLLMSFSRWLFALLEKKTASKLFEKVWIFDAIMVVIFAWWGLSAVSSHTNYFWHSQTSLLGIPMLYVGFYLRKYWDKVSKIFTWYGCIISMLIVYFCAANHLLGGDLNSNIICNKALYWPLTLIAMYFCISLARLIENAKSLCSCFTLIGKNSFHIMALHFMFFKIVDMIVATAKGLPVESAMGYPYTYDCWYFYLLAGVFGSLGLILLLKRLKDIIFGFVKNL